MKLWGGSTRNGLYEWALYLHREINLVKMGSRCRQWFVKAADLDCVNFLPHGSFISRRRTEASCAMFTTSLPGCWQRVVPKVLRLGEDYQHLIGMLWPI